MGLETLSIEHVPASHRVHIAYFTDVSNAGFLQSQLLARNPDFEYAFIDATSTVSRVHVLAAVYKALTLLLAGNLKTPNVHSEIVCALSNTTNISESFRRWGITPATRDIIVVKVVCPKDGDPSTTADEPGNIWAHLVRNVQGMPAALTDEEIAKSTDWPKVRRYYKLNAVPGVEACKTDEEKAEEMKVLVLAGMALRGV